MKTTEAESQGYDNISNPMSSEVERLKSEIRSLQIEMAGKDAVITELYKDIGYYRKDRRDQMIQDQGRPECGK